MRGKRGLHATTSAFQNTRKRYQVIKPGQDGFASAVDVYLPRCGALKIPQGGKHPRSFTYRDS